ncbi:hypothetical protein FAI40_03640 [Acetobacteraceae bacterium]|nr:hypothetical protein FAI40_03640 [Acetobacteraceae bacterium]
MASKSFLSLFVTFASLLPLSHHASAETLAEQMAKAVHAQDQKSAPLPEKELPFQTKIFHQEERQINELERQNLKLKEENEKLKEPKPLSDQEEIQKIWGQTKREAAEREVEKETRMCRNLLWECQIPNHEKFACEDFTYNCHGLKNIIGDMSIDKPIQRHLGETDKFYPFGYVSPDGRVEGAYHQFLGYARAGDLASAFAIASAANHQDHDTLPDSFPKTSKAHPYIVTPEGRKKVLDYELPLRTECGMLLSQCVTLNTESAECFAHYNKTCGRHIPYLDILRSFRQEGACLNYKINSNLEPLKRLQLLRDCGRDPSNDPPDHSYMAVTDCHSLNLLCQVKQNKMPYCKAFIEGQCLTSTTPLVKSLLPHERPFWEVNSAPREAMTYPVINFPNCAALGNVLLITPHGPFKFYLGHVDAQGWLTVYADTKTLKKVAQIDEEGHLIGKTIQKNDDAHPILSHVKRVERIASDGTVWQCHRQNTGEKIHLFLTPKGGLFQVRTTVNGTFIFDDRFGFKPTEIQLMRQGNE